MKNEKIVKINTIGKVSKILSIIARVVVLIAAVTMVVIGIGVIFLPGDAIQASGTAQGQIILDGNSLPVDIVKFDQSNSHFSVMGMNFDYVLTETQSGSDRIIDITANADHLTGEGVKLAIILSCFFYAIMLVSVAVIFIFATKLAKALEKCESPFEENVIKALRKFSFSLIPFGAIMLLRGVGSIPIALVILIVILLSYCFSYGAQLQKESDETL